MTRIPAFRLLSLFATIAIVGCSNPADDVAKAEVSEATEETPNAATTTTSPANATTFVISADSTVDFLGSKAVGGEQPGGFKKFVGQLNVVDGQLAAEGSKIVIDMDSTWTNAGDRLTNHLKNGDFFDVPNFPTSTFAVSSVEADGDGQKVTGNLTLHGVTKSISFPAAIQVSDDNVSLRAEFAINRFDFDIEFPGQADNLIRKEVVMKLDVKATPSEADLSSVAQ
jgi:polyisoprenoid-binding protein YceI